MDSEDFQEFIRIDGEPVEFEWNIFPGHTTLGLLHENRRKMAQNGIKPEEFNDRIIFMSCDQRRINIANILQGTLPAHCILKFERLKTGEKLYERQYLSPRPPPKISLKHDHNWTKGNDQSGSTVEHQPVGKIVQQSLGEAIQAGSSKPTQSKPIDDRTENL